MRTTLAAVLVLVSCLHASGSNPASVSARVAEEFRRLTDSYKNFDIEQFSGLLKQLDAESKAGALVKLKAVLDSEDRDIRRRAALALHYLGDSSGVPQMIADRRPIALRIMGDRRAIPVLVDITSDKPVHRRAIALAALGDLKATNALDTIVSHLADFDRSGTHNPACSACYALGELGDKRAIPHLVALVQTRHQGMPKTYGNDANDTKHDRTDVLDAALSALRKLTGHDFATLEEWDKWIERPHRDRTPRYGEPSHPPDVSGESAVRGR